MAQPIVKYTLSRKGQVPEWINTSDSSFAGQHGITGNKTGSIPNSFGITIASLCTVVTLPERPIGKFNITD